jgi:hypothetical protein
VPTNIPPAAEARHYLLSTVRESQAAVIETIRTWTAINEQVTRTLRPRVPDVDLAGIVDRTFDIAEQTLAAQHQVARALAGLTSRQLDSALETVDTTVEVVETTIREGAERTEGLVEAAAALPQVAVDDTAVKAEETRQDRRSYEDRSVEELRERAAELEIEGRSSMTKDELIAGLRDHRQPKPAQPKPAQPKPAQASPSAARSQPSKQERKRDRRPYEERSVEELRERAGELEIEGRSSMGKDELIAALRQQSR